MKSFLIILTNLIFLCGCSHIQIFKNWNTTDTALLTTHLALTFIDYRTTSDMTKRLDEGYYEKYGSVYIGKHPTQGKVNTFFLCTTLAKTLVAGLLPNNKDSWFGIFGRESWLILNIGISGYAVYNNLEIGLEINF